MHKMAEADRHNGGRVVQSLGADWLDKPRTIAWEWLILNHRSWLRQTLTSFAPDLWAALPSLEFQGDDVTLSSGKVERLRLQSLPRRLSASHCQAIGEVIGLCSVLGLMDLHRDNVATGLDRNDRFVFTPIDIEGALLDVRTPRATGLIPASTTDRPHCGLAPLLEGIANDHICQVISGYLRAVLTLFMNGTFLTQSFVSNRDWQDWRIRVIPRQTSFYYAVLEKNDTVPDLDPVLLAESEIQQLKRGDIPSFFLTYRNPAIARLDQYGRPTEAGLPDELTRRLVPLVPPEHAFGLERRQTLIRAGTMDLLEYLMTEKGCPETSGDGLVARQSGYDLTLRGHGISWIRPLEPSMSRRNTKSWNDSQP